MLDWDRDGHDDLIMVQFENLTIYNQETKKADVRNRIRMFINTRSRDRGEQIYPREKSELATLGSPNSATDIELGLEAIDFEHEEFNRKFNEQKPTLVHFAFADMDDDGNFDIIYTEAEYSRESLLTSDRDRRRYQNKCSAIYWKRNLTSQGPPKFAEAVELFKTTDDWIINSISAGDLDDDGTPELIANVYKGLVMDLSSELWLLKAE